METALNFLGVSLTLYAVGHLYMLIFQDKIIKPTVRCPYCKQYISESVSGLIRHVFCLQCWLIVQRRFGVAIAQPGKTEGKISLGVIKVLVRNWLMPSQDLMREFPRRYMCVK
jgi:hypothetical protein